MNDPYTSFYNALKDEGYTLPDETVDVQIQLTPDGLPQLLLRINLYGDNLAKFGRAMEKMSLARGR